MEVVKQRWESTKRTAKYIFEQTLRLLMPTLIEKEVKESLNKIEEKFTLKLNTCMILIKYIEYVVKEAKNTWKKIYRLHQPSDFIAQINEKK